ncbi:hypothetical protein ACFL2Q_15255 [Thermodesulfobacteriota bacterium]
MLTGTKWTFLLVFVLSGTLLIASLAWSADTGKAKRIALDKAKGMLGKTDVIFIDARTVNSWNGSGVKIVGAVREEPKKYKEWAGKYPKDKTLIVYCS